VRPRKSILHLIPTLGQAGAERQLSYLACEQANRGWDVHIAIRAGGPNRKRLDDAAVAIHTVTPYSNYDPLAFFQLGALFARIRPAIVQTWILQSDFLGGVTARVLGIPWILSERSSGGAYGNAMKHRLRVFVARGASSIISNSRSGDEYWKQVLDGEVPRYVIPNAVPVAEINETRAVDANTLAPEGAPIIAYVGRTTLLPKNTHGFVLALRQVLPQTTAHAVICGEGPERSEIESMIFEHQLSERVHLRGTEANVWGILKSTTVFVSTSFYEGNPNAVLEAMACRCPLVVSDIAAHREILDENSAVFVDPTSPTSIADGILRVLRDPDAAQRRAEVAAARAQGLSIARTAERYERVYEEVLAPLTAKRTNNP
jgi:glycosyltransferase involved in cell wall biosynthesis